MPGLPSPLVLAAAAVAAASDDPTVHTWALWGAALLLGQGAYEFLGTQGDPWDTQSDMFFALVGALTMLVVFSRLHDRQLVRRDPAAGPRGGAVH